MPVAWTEPVIKERLEPVLDVARKEAASVDREGRFPEASIQALKDQGFFGLTIPVEHGGWGGNPEMFTETLGQIASVCGSTAMVYLMHLSAALPLSAAPPVGQEGLLSRMAAGEVLATLACSEKGSRSHFWCPVSRAKTELDSSVLIDADKSFVTAAGHAGVMVATTLAPQGDDFDLFAIPTDTAGVDIAAPWKGMAFRGNASSHMKLKVSTPLSWRLGAPGDGNRLLMEVILPWFNIGMAAVSLGIASAALNAAIAHATGATFEESASRLRDLPTIRAKLAQAHIQLDSTQAYLKETVHSVMNPSETTMLKVLAVKAAANETAISVTDAAMRVCGGAAYSEQLGVERNFRDARAGAIMAPTVDVLYDFVGKALTGLPLF